MNTASHAGSFRAVIRVLLAVATQVPLANSGAATISAASPPVVFSVEPEEDGRLVFLPIVAQTQNDPPSNLFSLRVTMQNNSTNDIRLTNIRTVFTHADNATLAYQFSRDVLIAGGQGATEYLSPKDPDERIQLPEPAPVSVQIQLSFEGYRLPATLQRGLAPYESPGPGGKYLFPANESDLGPEMYFSHVDPHTGGSQFFGYDFHVQEWNGQNFSSIKSGGDATKNEDRVGWNVPIYAMADGVVIRASTGFEDNPAPGDRVIQRMGEYSVNAISEVKVTKLAADRAASVVRDSSGNMRLAVWDLEDRGRNIIPRGSAQGEAVEEIATDALSGSRLVTAVRTAAGNLRVIVWDVSSDGTTVTRRGERDAAAVKEVSLIKISSSRFATAARTEEDALRLIVWEVSGDGMTVSLLSDAFAGVASSVSIVALTETRLATALRTSPGTLRVIVWELLDDGAAIDRRGEATGDLITQTVAVKNSGSKFDTAMRTAAGDLKVVRWVVSEDGEDVAQALEATAGQIQDVAIAAAFDDAVMTSVITEQGNFKDILWRIPEANEAQNLFFRWGEREAGTVNGVSIDLIDGGLFLSGVRTATGDLKVIAWWAGSGGGNNVVILHGNCRVLYAHFRHGTVDPAVAYPGAIVAAGQYLGRMGNSGSSEGPHTHIHAERVSSLLSIEEIIALDAQDALPLRGYRPVPFHCARAVRLSALQPGGEPADSFSTMQGHGVYFAPYAIRPTWLKEMYVDWSATCASPTGRKECVPIGRLDFYGPFPTVTQALNAGCWGHQLFIRRGTYNESVTFSRSMTVRSYDGTAIIRH